MDEAIGLLQNGGCDVAKRVQKRLHSQAMLQGKAKHVQKRLYLQAMLQHKTKPARETKAGDLWAQLHAESDCLGVDELASLVRGRLSEAEAKPLLDHIGVCKGCSSLYETLSEADRLAKQAIEAVVQEGLD
jgi:hypothetical protein